MATAECTTPAPGADAPISSPPSEAFDLRQLKIRVFRPSARAFQRSEAPPMPSLHLQGRWLEQAGFPIGAHVRVQVAPRRLVVELIESDDDSKESRAPHACKSRAGTSRR